MTPCHSPLSTPHYPLTTIHYLRPAVFFDRDGVLNVDVNYLYKIEDFCWMPGAKEAIKYYNDQGYLVFVVTNQSGVARGYYSEADVHNLHKWMQKELAEAGARIDAFYHCPHHVQGSVAEYRLDCGCRKPAPGLILQAMEEWPVDKKKSFLIGDKPSDVEAAQTAGIKGYLFPGGNLYDFVTNINP